jgi:hypothetical protein
VSELGFECCGCAAGGLGRFTRDGDWGGCGSVNRGWVPGPRALRRWQMGRAVPGPTLRAELVAQARHYVWVVPGTGTKRNGPCRA